MQTTASTAPDQDLTFDLSDSQQKYFGEQITRLLEGDKRHLSLIGTWPLSIKLAFAFSAVNLLGSLLITFYSANVLEASVQVSMELVQYVLLVNALRGLSKIRYVYVISDVLLTAVSVFGMLTVPKIQAMTGIGDYIVTLASLASWIAFFWPDSNQWYRDARDIRDQLKEKVPSIYRKYQKRAMFVQATYGVLVFTTFARSGLQIFHSLTVVLIACIPAFVVGCLFFIWHLCLYLFTEDEE